jgi:hypothetical protein
MAKDQSIEDGSMVVMGITSVRVSEFNGVEDARRCVALWSLAPRKLGLQIRLSASGLVPTLNKVKPLAGGLGAMQGEGQQRGIRTEGWSW